MAKASDCLHFELAPELDYAHAGLPLKERLQDI
jgi:hypothetical protein